MATWRRSPSPCCTVILLSHRIVAVVALSPPMIPSRKASHLPFVVRVGAGARMAASTKCSSALLWDGPGGVSEAVLGSRVRPATHESSHITSNGLDIRHWSSTYSHDSHTSNSHRGGCTASNGASGYPRPAYLQNPEASRQERKTSSQYQYLAPTAARARALLDNCSRSEPRFDAEHELRAVLIP